MDGRRLSLQNIDDPSGKLPIWRAEGPQPSWTIRIKQNAQSSEQTRFPAQLVFVDSQGGVRAERIGYVSPKSAVQHQLSQKFQQLSQKANQKLTITAPTVTTQVPWAQQNDSKLLYEQRTRYLERSLASPEGKDPQAHAQAMAIALWQQSKGGRKLVMQAYPDVLRDRLSQVPEMTIGRLQISSEQSQRLVANRSHTVQFAKDVFPTKEGDATLPSVSVLTAEGNRVLIGAVATRSIALPAEATYRAVFSQNLTSEKVVDMQVMDLPVVAQTPAELSAIKAGDRTHLTLDEEPFSGNGVRAGQVVVAQATAGGEQIALRIGDRHRIDMQLLAKAGAIQRWSEAENLPAAALFEQLAAARRDGKELWGLNVQPLGAYDRGRITPFDASTQSQQAAVSHQPKFEVESPTAVSQPIPEKSAAQQLWEQYSRQNSGVMSAIAASTPQLQTRLDSEMARRAMGDGHSLEAIQQAISQHSPAAKTSGQPDIYAQTTVEKESTAIREHQRQAPQQSQSSACAHDQKRARSRDNGMGM